MVDVAKSEKAEKERVQSKFLATIDRYAKREEKKIREDIEKAEKKQKNRIENELVDSFEEAFHLKVSMIKDEFMLFISTENYKARKRITLEKEKIVNSIFKECREKIQNTKIDFEKIKKHCQNILDILGGKCKIFIKPQDFFLKDDILRFFGSECEVFTDKKIKLGGVRGENEKLVIDETFDSRLAVERRKFQNDLGYELVKYEG
jgi:vacuolar-type H+-ATPase subunit E/Vma4